MNLTKSLNKRIRKLKNAFKSSKKKDDKIEVVKTMAKILDERGNEILHSQLNEFSELQCREVMSKFERTPLISIVIPLYKPDFRLLDFAISSIREQIYENWELCLVDDGSNDAELPKFIARIIGNEKRIKYHKLIKNSGISGATNYGVKISEGEYIAFMDQDDMIPSCALFWIANEINQDPTADFIYSDECKISEDGERYFDFYFKPDWSPTLIINHHYLGHLSVCKKSVFSELGGLRKEYDFSQDYDFALRCISARKKIKHVERVLYYWRAAENSAANGGKPYARNSNICALNDFFKSLKIDASSFDGPFANVPLFRRLDNKKVSIIIPSDSVENIVRSIDGIVRNTSYRNYEIVIVTNSEVGKAIKSKYSFLDFLTLCNYDKPYNFSDKCNVGALSAKGEYLVFYNDDVYPNHETWLDRLLDPMMLPWVGAVSPVLLFENKQIQYAGMISGTPGLVGTSFNGCNFEPINGSPFSPMLIRDISVLSGAVTLISKDLFERVNGFDAIHTPTRASDVDLSYKVLKEKKNCVYTPYSVLTHIGNHSWNEPNKKDKADIYCLNHWGKFVDRDPFFTDSMKQFLYKDFDYKYRVYSPTQGNLARTDDAKDVLIISHELTLTGAPIALIALCKDVISRGDIPVVISPVDGPLKQAFLEMGITVIIDQSIINGHWFFRQQYQHYDVVIANTLVVGRAVEELSSSLTKVYWWIHESRAAFEMFKNCLPKKIGNNVTVIPVSEYVANLLREFTNYHVWHQLIPATINEASEIEFAPAFQPSDSSKILVIGSIEVRKGQDLVVDAIKLLSNSTNLKGDVEFYGLAFDQNILNQIENNTSLGNLKLRYEGVVEHEKLLDRMVQAKAILIASRDEPLSLVAIEAFMLGKPCIISNSCGIATYCNNKNAIFFESGNAEELANVLGKLLRGEFDLKSLSTGARQLFEDEFKVFDSRKFY